MWRAVTDAVGVEARDALWAHPDLLPTADDIDDPSALVARLTGTEHRRGRRADDEFDQALEQLLRGETPAAPRRGRRATRTDGPRADRGARPAGTRHRTAPGSHRLWRIPRRRRSRACSRHGPAHRPGTPPRLALAHRAAARRTRPHASSCAIPAGSRPGSSPRSDTAPASTLRTIGAGARRPRPRSSGCSSCSRPRSTGRRMTRAASDRPAPRRRRCRGRDRRLLLARPRRARLTGASAAAADRRPSRGPTSPSRSSPRRGSSRRHGTCRGCAATCRTSPSCRRRRRRGRPARRAGRRVRACGASSSHASTPTPRGRRSPPSSPAARARPRLRRGRRGRAPRIAVVDDRLALGRSADSPGPLRSAATAGASPSRHRHRPHPECGCRAPAGTATAPVRLDTRRPGAASSASSRRRARVMPT